MVALFRRYLFEKPDWVGGNYALFGHNCCHFSIEIAQEVVGRRIHISIFKFFFIWYIAFWYNFRYYTVEV